MGLELLVTDGVHRITGEGLFISCHRREPTNGTWWSIHMVISIVKLCIKSHKHFIPNKMGYMDLCASILGFHHHQHLLEGELNARGDLRSSVKCLLAFAATNQRLRGTNGIRRLHQEEKNNNMNNMSKLRNNNNREGKIIFGKKNNTKTKDQQVVRE